MTINYRDTLNLPATELSMKAGLPKKSLRLLIFGMILISIKKLEKKILETKILFCTMVLHMQMDQYI
jgi:hypothetical protein